MESKLEVNDVQYLKTMLDSLRDMIRIVTREGKIAYTNYAYDHRLGCGIKTEGHPYYEVYGTETESKQDQVLMQEVLDGRTRQTTRTMGGRMYSVSASAINNPATGSPVAVMEVFRDITLDVNIRNNLVTQAGKLQRDLNLAKQVQESLVRGALPAIEGYELFAHYLPCETVGGDMYDVFVCGDKLVMYIADAAGHGIMPAMLGVFFSRAAHAANTLGITDPSQILGHVLQEYGELKIEDTFYITGFVLVVDMPTGDFSYSNAGLSVVPIHYEAATGNVKELYMEAPPISHWFSDAKFPVKNGHMDPGDRILLYTDGLADVQTDDVALGKLYDMFGEDSFTCDGFVRGVRRELHTRQSDDLTMLMLVRDVPSRNRRPRQTV